MIMTAIISYALFGLFIQVLIILVFNICERKKPLLKSALFIIAILLFGFFNLYSSMPKSENIGCGNGLISYVAVMEFW